MTTNKTYEAELDGVRYIKERDILVAPPPLPHYTANDIACGSLSRQLCGMGLCQILPAPCLSFMEKDS